ncbi:MAG: alpha/beta hydrolase [Kordiimonadaceae bacterium]|jgi:pimeloyl-ACP methyl ester carboxylesterase|nr:alpha/beta hydrolase [Kordiimonadaceae bacterium]MBT6036499.1 alpha/beta hydrolase [Kordiimonadaceae bacterium]MBT6331000.1 alpha/beta hydrolase [Kordiimonadaceae bacterium]MBT7581447.1 alpha/beta hydrolase [Kordiimonadaceae bacterium]
MTEKTNVENTLPLLFVHGSFANANSWRKIIDCLPDHFDCHSVNLPGHGGMADSDDFDSPTFKPEFDILKSALENIPNTEHGIHLIGHSYGGVVALAAAMDNALPIKKLTLFEPVDVAVLNVFSQTNTLNIIRGFRDEYNQALAISDALACSKVIDFWGGAGSFDAVPAHIQTAMTTMTKNNIRHWVLCTENGREIEHYKNLDIPVTFINGSRSHDVAKKISSTLNNNLPNSNLYLIDNASHFMITSHAEDCAKILQT